MPINYAHIHNNLDHFADLTQKKLEEQRQALEKVLSQIETAASVQAEVEAAVQRAEQQAGNLYTAKPSHEAMLASFSLPECPKYYTLIAADGSQINPSRHRALQFCLINVGLIHVEHGSGETPVQQVFSKILDQDELYTNEGTLIGEEEVALHRDLLERIYLMEALPVAIEKPTITLTDGPLEVFTGPTLSGERRQKVQEQNQTIEQRMQALGVINAGYIDKPGAEMINRMLDLFAQSQSASDRPYEAKKRANKGVSDLAIFQNRLAPGERSALFYVISKNEAKQEATKVCFFLLNVSNDPDEPWLARVECPAWLAEDPDTIDILHAALYRDAQVLDAMPYPYVLHRAHELAVVNVAEHDEVEEMLMSRLDHDQLPSGSMSHKQSLKSLSKR